MTNNFEADGGCAWFARLNADNVVETMSVIDRSRMLDSEGVEQEALGIALSSEELGDGNWLRISHEPSFRGGLPGHWWVYNPETDTFIEPTSAEELTEETPAE